MGWAPRSRSTRNSSCPITTCRSTTARSRRGVVRTRNTSPACSKQWPSRATSTSMPRGTRSRPSSRRSSCTARAGSSRSNTRTVTAERGNTPPNTKVSSRGSAVVTKVPSPTGRASSTRATCARWRVALVAGRGSSRRPWRSPSAAYTFPTCATCPSASRPSSWQHWNCLNVIDSLPSVSPKRSTRGSGSCSTLGSTTSPCHAMRARWRAVKRSEFGLPARSGRVWWARCMCSTNRRSACISETTAD